MMERKTAWMSLAAVAAQAMGTARAGAAWGCRLAAYTVVVLATGLSGCPGGGEMRLGPSLVQAALPGSAQWYVDFGYGGERTGTWSNPFSTVGEAVDAASDGDVVCILGSSTVTTSSERPRIAKALRLESAGGPVVIGVPPGPGAMVRVPAGWFEMGDPWGEGYERELPVHDVYLSSYWVGRYEVTNAAYADMLNWAQSRGYLTAASSSTARGYGQELLDLDDPCCQVTYVEGRFGVRIRDNLSMARHPVLMVSWYGAAAYCNWLSEATGLTPCYDTSTWECDFLKDGYHLPTEAQWERAAAWDGTRHFRYGSGGDSVSCASANHWADGPCNPQGLAQYPYTAPVGHYPEAMSPVGCFDMCGNVWEWCNDWWYRLYGTGPVTDPTGPNSGSSRVTRGGSWYCTASYCRSSFRNDHHAAPASMSCYVGFRLAR